MKTMQLLASSMYQYSTVDCKLEIRSNETGHVARPWS